MDQLGHVNNVTYVDYLQEARVDMLRVHPPAAGGEALAEGVVVVRHEVKYLRPLVFRRRPVNVEVWVTEIRAASFTLAYEIFDETEDGRLVYLRARSVLSPYVFGGEHPRRLTPQEREVLQRFLEPDPEPLQAMLAAEEPPPERRHLYEAAVRFSDVDAYRHVNNVKYFEYYQEARISLVGRLARLMTSEDAPGAVNSVVVAQIDVDYRTPMFFREKPYVVETWVSRVGRSSFVIDGAIREHADGPVLSRGRAVMVAFDPAAQRAAELTAPQRELLEQAGSGSLDRAGRPSPRR
jgi:acyl-CoA thioester hydrolase